MPSARSVGTLSGPPEPRTPPPLPDASARTHIRGSSLLLFGRLISVVLNFAVQVLIVRYLTKHDYGAFAYSLGFVAIASSWALAGMGKTIPRLVPIYLEQHRYARAFGGLAIAGGTVLGLGVSCVILLHGFQGAVADAVGTDPAYVPLLLILIALAPLDALDNLLQHTAAVFVGPRAIFLRRQVLGPSLRLTAILLVSLVGGDARLLAYAYVATGFVGVWLYVTVLTREWRKRRLLGYLHPRRLEWPFRDVFGMSMPLLSSDLSVVLRVSFVVVLLGYFHTAPAVAEYRAVLPVAALNMLVFEAFGFLFVPVASRMFARGDRAGISDLYWQTCLWIAVVTFPVFAVTTSLAGPVTVLLFGERYASAGPILAVLAVGHYVNAALGFNAATLRVHGRMRIIVASEAVVAVGSIALSVLLVRAYGPLGAAFATTAALVLQNACNHAGLWIAGTGVSLIDRQFARLYLVVVAAIAGLWLAQWLLAPSIQVGVALAAVASLAVMWLTRRAVHLDAMFPELLRLPLVGRLLR
ncbi:MAG TPA: oligosaccharide flippase family protein [Vicinamibacterales bacterium]|nr:oligosaccharide flippase family protein [Vicinamibacterales bacterium]